jgi:phosphate starvation-inducible PhoH-like protein
MEAGCFPDLYTTVIHPNVRRGFSHMSKSAKSSKRVDARTKRRQSQPENAVIDIHTGASYAPVDRPLRNRLEFKSQAQGHYHELFQSRDIILGTGPAGTGKTFCAVSWAAEQFIDKRVGALIFTRPCVEAGEEYGFLPGDISQKCEPYWEPIKRILLQWFSESHLEYLLKRKQVEFAPLGFIRGLTFENCIVVCDEGQNTTPKQMKLLLTRMGRNCTTIVNGDTDQKDIEGLSGLEDLVKRLDGMRSVGHYRFTDKDIVRSDIVREILKRYRPANYVEEVDEEEQTHGG